MMIPQYIGRFAPSPTGALHLGSLLAAVGSFLDARAHEGKWLLRIEDIDPPRVVTGSAEQILKTLETFGLHWDGTETYQSQHLYRYQDAMNELNKKQLIYPCFCSRKQVQQLGLMGMEGIIYAKTCREPKTVDLNLSHSWRIKAKDQNISFIDRIEGITTQNVAKTIGDFVLKRADGLWAYQLAVVVDDAESNITHVVRGNDLLSSTARQTYLQNCLGYPTPQYAHLPIIMNIHGQKLSKQTLAPAIKLDQPVVILKQILSYLNLSAPTEIDTIEGLLQWATSNWNINRIQRGFFTLSY